MNNAEMAAARHFAVASDIKRYAITAIRAAALTDAGVTIFVHPRVIIPGTGAIAMQTTLDGRPAVRVLVMQSVIASCAADGVRPESMGDFCAAELEAHIARMGGAL